MSKRKLPCGPVGQKLSKIAIFSQIPRHNQMDILKKLDFREFARFQQCSKETVEIGNSFKYILPLKVKRIEYVYYQKFLVTICDSSPSLGKYELATFLDLPIRIETAMFRVTGRLFKGHLSFLEEFCVKTRITSSRLVVELVGTIGEAQIVDRLLNLLNPHSLVASPYVPYVTLTLEATGMKKLKTIDLNTVKFGEADLLLLEAPTIRIVERAITTSDINKFFKQWTREERVIKELIIAPIPDDHQEIFENLEFSVLWAPELHGSSPFSHLMIDEKEPALKKILTLKSVNGKNLFVAVVKKSALDIRASEYETIEDIERWILRYYTPKGIL